MITSPPSALKLRDLGIAITRPAGQASKLAALVEAQGGRAHLFPLVDIEPLNDYAAFNSRIRQLDTDDWAIFISSNAVQQGMPRIRQAWPILPAHLRFAAIGPTTGAELQRFGIEQVLTPSGRYDSESLLALPEMRDMQDRRVLIVRGVGGRELLAQVLAERGAIVTFGECYRRMNPQPDAEPLARLWQNKGLQAIVVTSSEAMRHLLDLAGTAEWLRKVVICVNHARIAELPQRIGLKTAIAAAPGDEAMVQCLVDAIGLQ